YDDGDGEEMGLKDVQFALKLYEVNKDDDSKADKAFNNPENDGDEAKMDVDQPVYDLSSEEKDGDAGASATDAGVPAAADAAMESSNNNGDTQQKPSEAEDGGDNSKDAGSAPITFISL
ncbi:MAG: hypothetical protein SGARI_007794, partial [Bacillariaceae sp.]